MGVGSWPESAGELRREQERLARLQPPVWRPSGETLRVAGCFVCFSRGRSGTGAAGDPGWAASALVDDGRLVAYAVVRGEAGAPYEPGLLAAREGPLLGAAVRALAVRPDLLLVNATGRDHLRGAGLALHLGAVLDVPTVGVTHRLLVAEGNRPDDRFAATTPFRVAGNVVSRWVRTRAGTRPLAVHAAWHTDVEQAVELVLATVRGARTPAPLRLGRELARTARATDEGARLR